MSNSIQNITGHIVIYPDIYNKSMNSNELSKLEIDIHADVPNSGKDKYRKLVIEKLKYGDIKAEYSVHKATNRVIIKLYNQKDGKLLREIPAAKMLDVAADIIEQAGILLDARI